MKEPLKKRDTKLMEKFNDKRHELNQKNDDYFICPANFTTIKEKIRAKKYSTLKELNEELGEMNKDFGED